MPAYRLYMDGDETNQVATASNPAAALRDLAARCGFELAEQSGRYGTTTTGRKLAALTEPWATTRYADHGTTRV
jgi:hypothetical protein